MKNHKLHRYKRTDQTLIVDDKPEVTRINEITRTAKANWFALMAYLAFVGITLLGVQDVDLFVTSRETPLPLIGVSIPTARFFLFAPLLGAALYIYLQLHLLKLWDALATARPNIEGKPLAEHITPWRVSDLGLLIIGNGAQAASPLRWLNAGTVLALVFVAAPLVIFFFWLRYFPAHEELETLAMGGLVALTCTVMVLCGWAAFWRLRGYAYGPRGVLTAVMFVVISLPVASIGWFKTEGWVEAYVDWPEPEWVKPWRYTKDKAGDPVRQIFALSQADLVGVELTPKPADWLPYDTQKAHFRGEWCKRQGWSPQICGQSV